MARVRLERLAGFIALPQATRRLAVDFAREAAGDLVLRSEIRCRFRAQRLGNFVAAQVHADTQDSAILHIDIVQRPGERPRILGVEATPIEIQQRFYPEIDGTLRVPVIVSNGSPVLGVPWTSPDLS